MSPMDIGHKVDSLSEPWDKEMGIKPLSTAPSAACYIYQAWTVYQKQSVHGRPDLYGYPIHLNQAYNLADIIEPTVRKMYAGEAAARGDMYVDMTMHVLTFIHAHLRPLAIQLVIAGIGDIYIYNLARIVSVSYRCQVFNQCLFVWRQLPPHLHNTPKTPFRS